MSNEGITRINITDKVSGRGAWRFEVSRPLQPVANTLYRDAFAQMGMPLLPGDTAIDCTSEEFASGYDRALGIDVFLRFISGMQSTLQEKFLTTTYSTVTVEYYQNRHTKEPGDWFKMRADYYFVGYHDGRLHFNRWILLDWPAVQRATARGRIAWIDRDNTRDGARSSFRYANFWDFPAECLIGGYWIPQPGKQTTKQEPVHEEAYDDYGDELAIDVLAHQQRYLYQTD